MEKLKGKSFEYMEISDSQLINEVAVEIRLFSIMGNESLRLKHFFNYYKSLGVNRFFIIDNNSTDNSVELALKEDKVHAFSVNESYENHWC